LTTPQELLDQLAQSSGLSIDGRLRIPHDLWPARDLPPLTLIERLSLILAGFDLTYTIGHAGDQVQIVAKPDEVALVRSYTPRRDLQGALDELAELFPTVQVQRAGRRLRVSGLYEEHMLIERWLRGESLDQALVGGVTRYTLTIQNQPLGAVLNQVALRAGAQLEVDSQIRSRLDQLVTFRVKNATLDELFQEALKGTGIRHRFGRAAIALTTDE
jgi:hypothetical protein